MCKNFHFRAAISKSWTSYLSLSLSLSLSLFHSDIEVALTNSHFSLHRLHRQRRTAFGRRWPVWPDVGIKDSPKFSKRCPKVSVVVFCFIIIDVWDKPNRPASIIGLLLKKNCELELWKIVQYGHTADDSRRRRHEKDEKKSQKNFGTRGCVSSATNVPTISIKILYIGTILRFC